MLKINHEIYKLIENKIEFVLKQLPWQFSDTSGELSLTLSSKDQWRRMRNISKIEMICFLF